MFIKLVLTLCIGASAICGDILVDRSDNKFVKALTDNCTHAFIGGFTWAVALIYRKNYINSNYPILEIIICIAASSFIDVDHFIAAKSFKLKDIHQLKSRPFMHCTTFMLTFCALFVGGSYLFNSQNLNSFGWIVCAAVLSHHTRDATRRGFWMFPLGSTPPIKYWIYILLISFLPYIIGYYSLVFKPKMPINIVNLKNVQSLV